RYAQAARATPWDRCTTRTPNTPKPHATYRTRSPTNNPAPDLEGAHASTPFVMSFDDPEVNNDWAGDPTEQNTPPALFLLRRAAAFQAWYEHMPVRKALSRAVPTSWRIAALRSAIS